MSSASTVLYFKGPPPNRDLPRGRRVQPPSRWAASRTCRSSRKGPLESSAGSVEPGWCEYVGAYIYTHIHIYIHIHSYVYIYTSTYIYVYMYIYAWIYVYTYIDIHIMYIHVGVCLCTNLNVYVYMYIYICRYIMNVFKALCGKNLER